MSNLLLTTEYSPDYVINLPDGGLLNLCDNKFIITCHDDLLAMAEVREQKLGLHLIAANTGVPTTVLEHPSLDMFRRVVRKGRFETIGFTTLIPSLERIEEMIRVCRQESPQSRIVIGGHGVAHDYGKTIGSDIVCEGDGIPFMQDLYGTRTDSFVHPILPYRISLKVLMDSPLIGRFAGNMGYVIACGAGCPMGCDYCPASSFYDRKRITYLDGEQLFQTMVQLKAEHPQASFFLWDQDFLMDRKRYRTLGRAVQRYNDTCGDVSRMIAWSSQVSIRTLSAVDLDELVDFGCRLLAVGIEASEERWKKRQGQDPKALFEELERRGIGAFAFFILCWVDHDLARVYHEVDYVQSLNPTLNHFTLLTPEPGTAQYEQFKADGKLLDLPPRCFNYATLQFKHPSITPDQARTAWSEANRACTDKLGAGVLRVAKKELAGFVGARARLGSDSRLASHFEARARALLPLLNLKRRYYPQGVSYELGQTVRRGMEQAGISPSWKSQLAVGLLNTAMRAHQAKRQVFGVHFHRWQPALYRYVPPQAGDVLARCYRSWTPPRRRRIQNIRD